MQATLSHYRVLEQIGEGGQGKVFLAHDERLPRDVALKILPVGAVADESARERFKKEAFTLSKLNHPNIATIFDFDSQNGTDFLVEEYIPGQSLDAMLAVGPLPEHDILHLGVQICEGLATAHEQGILHRDLKPANLRVMPTPDRRVKILDFGLAKVLPKTAGSDDATATFSETQSVAGTLPYMAPEQVMNERLDARTDIWALGCVLYEMATGRRPFAGSGITLADQIRHEAATAPAQVNAKVSAGLEAIILKCLEKDPGRRYASTRDIAVALRQLETGVVPLAQRERQRRRAWKIVAAFMAVLVLAGAGYAAYRTLVPRAAPIRSIAVLPLANLSGDPNQEYFADGMTESLITDLGRLTGLKSVIARGSVMQFKNTKKPLAEIAHELNVDALITGSVLRAGDRVRVTAQLISPNDGKQLWTEHYERDLTDVLRLQSELTGAIAGEIRVKLTGAEQARLASARPVNPEAYDAYLLGRYHMLKMTPPEFDKALECYQLALEKDPSYTPASIGIAFTWSLREHLGQVAHGEGWDKAITIVTKVLETDPTSAAAHQVFAGYLAWHQWRWEDGVKEYQRAIELDPKDPDARCFYSFTLFAMRRREEARRQIEAAVELDPYNALFRKWLGIELMNQGHYDEAFVQLDRAAALEATPDLHLTRARAFHRKQEYQQALEELKKFLSGTGQAEAVKALEQGYAHGDYKAAVRSAADILAVKFPKGAAGSLLPASLYVSAGENDRALDFLEAACDSRRGPLPYVNVLAMYEPLRPNPRFQALLRRMNLPQ